MDPSPRPRGRPKGSPTKSEADKRYLAREDRASDAFDLKSLVGMEKREIAQVVVPVKDRVKKHDPAAITKLTNEEIIASLRRCRGLYYLCAEHLGVTKSKLANRIVNDPELDAIAKDERGKMLDKAERKLMEAVEDGQQWAIQLMLKTLGRDRGYVERQEVHSVNQVRLEIVEEIVDSSTSGKSMEIPITVNSNSYSPRLPETFNDAAETEGDIDTDPEAD